MIISFLATLIGALVTGSQALLIHLQGKGICLDEGCELVDSLTRVDPFYFNVFGLCFFLLASLGINRARKGSDLWLRFVSLLLLAALAAEAVLLSFQLFVTEVFCSYCLIILALVVIANLFLGPKQIFKGVIIFAAVVIASTSLDYSPQDKNTEISLNQGSITRFEVAGSTNELFFFFSENCKYCEQVLEFMNDGTSCTVNFNPIEPFDAFSYPGADNTEAYRPDVNRRYLKNLGIKGIPALLVKREGTITVLRGASGITDFLSQNCALDTSGGMTSLPQLGSSTISLPISSTDDGCLPQQECDDPLETSYSTQ